LAGGELDDDVQVADVPGVLLEQVEQDTFQGRGVGAIPALAGLPDLVQIVGGHHGAGPPGLIAQVSQETGQGLLGTYLPAAVLLVGPRVGEVAALETPLEPAQLDMAQVLDQLERRPAGGQPAAAQLRGGQGGQLGGQPRPEVVKVAQEDVGPRGGRGGRLGKRRRNRRFGRHPVIGTSCHRPPFRLRLLPLAWPGALSPM
jgi:hypothetical protein